MQCEADAMRQSASDQTRPGLRAPHMKTFRAMLRPQTRGNRVVHLQTGGQPGDERGIAGTGNGAGKWLEETTCRRQRRGLESQCAGGLSKQVRKDEKRNMRNPKPLLKSDTSP